MVDYAYPRVVFFLALHWPFAACVYNSIFGLQLQERRLGALPRLNLARKDSVGAEQSLHILVEGDLEDVLDDGLGGVEGEAHELGGHECDPRQTTTGYGYGYLYYTCTQAGQI